LCTKNISAIGVMQPNYTGMTLSIACRTASSNRLNLTTAVNQIQCFAAVGLVSHV